MTERITYTLLDPTGNITLLAETPVPAGSQPLTARRLTALEPDTEQVGFVTLAEDRILLRMAGGEFCGNASMSAAALYMHRRNRREGTVSVLVSGTEEPVTAAVRLLPGGAWRGSVSMPRPLSVGRERLPDGRCLPVVRFPGITHVLLEADEIPVEEAETLAPAWCRQLGAEALGLMFLNPERSAMRPLVWVPAAETLCWESSCASGTTAVGAFLASEAGQPQRLSLSQPGGTLEIAADPGGGLVLTGTVRILRDGAEACLPAEE